MVANGGASSPLILISKRTSLSSRNPISVKDIEAYPLVLDLSFFLFYFSWVTNIKEF